MWCTGVAGRCTDVWLQKKMNDELIMEREAKGGCKLEDNFGRKGFIVI